ncbi:MAG: hypothetical protein ABJA82_17420 [Myxococcales bacterium]
MPRPILPGRAGALRRVPPEAPARSAGPAVPTRQSVGREEGAVPVRQSAGPADGATSVRAASTPERRLSQTLGLPTAVRLRSPMRRRQDRFGIT